MFPAPLSARKTSPFGAVRIVLGMSRPDANSDTVNPLGNCGSAWRGGEMTSGERELALVA